MANAVPAVVAVVGTLLGSVLTYLFQRKTSERAETIALQREIRAERVRAYSAYSTALTEFIRGQLDWYNRRGEDANSTMTLSARVESYRLKGVAQTALFQVRLVASDPALMDAAGKAFDLTRPIHYSRDSTDLKTRTGQANKAIDYFVALAAAEVQSAGGHVSASAPSDSQVGSSIEGSEPQTHQMP